MRIVDFSKISLVTDAEIIQILLEQELMEDVSTLTGGGGYQRKTPDTVIEGVMRDNDLVFEIDALQR